MDTARLAAIRAREQAASRGPWAYRPQTWPADAYSGACTLHDVVAPFGAGPALVSIALCRAVGVGMDRRAADAAFIAAARVDVPDLLAEVDRLRAVVPQIETEIARLTAENERLVTSDTMISIWARRSVLHWVLRLLKGEQE